MECTYIWPYVTGDYAVIALVVLTFMAMVISIPGNFLTGYVIIRTEVLRSEPAYLLIFSVCLADTVVSSVTQPLFIATILSGTRSSCYLDNAYFSIAWISSVASSLGIAAITIDRYLFIVYPMYYREYMSQKRAVIMMSIVWVTSVAFGILPIVYHNSLILQSSVLFLMILVSICMVYLYGRVFKTLKTGIVPPLPSGQKKKKSRSQNQATRTVSLVVLSFIGCWSPWVIVSFMISLHETLSCLDQFKESSTVVKLYWIFLAFGYCNSSLNVFIYSRKNTVLREAVKRHIGFITLQPTITAVPKTSVERMTKVENMRKFRIFSIFVRNENEHHAYDENKNNNNAANNFDGILDSNHRTTRV